MERRGNKEILRLLENADELVVLESIFRFPKFVVVTTAASENSRWVL